MSRFAPASLRRRDVRNYQRILTIVMLATAALATGCATVGSTQGIATPWGAAGIHSFAPEKNAPQPSERKVNAQVAKMLDDASRAQNLDEDVRVAAR
jgi:hypothetical protein